MDRRAERPPSSVPRQHREGCRSPVPPLPPSCSCCANEQPYFDKVPDLITSARLPAFPKVQTILRLYGASRPQGPDGLYRRGAGAARPALMRSTSGIRAAAAGTWPRQGGHAEAGMLPGDVAAELWRAAVAPHWHPESRRLLPPSVPEPTGFPSPGGPCMGREGPTAIASGTVPSS